MYRKKRIATLLLAVVTLAFSSGCVSEVLASILFTVAPIIL